jgi:hypothetical protein
MRGGMSGNERREICNQIAAADIIHAVQREAIIAQSRSEHFFAQGFKDRLGGSGDLFETICP